MAEREVEVESMRVVVVLPEASEVPDSWALVRVPVLPLPDASATVVPVVSSIFQFV